MVARSATCDVFSAIADPTRRKLLDLLRDGERSVMSLVGAFRVRQPTISRHLRVLREAGLVTVSEKGRQRFYAIRPDSLYPAAVWLATYEKFWTQKLDALGAYLEKSQPHKRSSAHDRKTP